MNKLGLLSVLLLAGLTIDSSQAQSGQKKAKKNTGNQAIDFTEEKEYITYLGHSDLRGGPVSKHTFDSLAKQGISVSGTVQKIDGFTFTYAERKVYEDSLGRPTLMVDLMTEFCVGDTFSSGIQSSIYQRTKKGDTAYFEGVRVILPNGKERTALPMKFVITK